MNKSLFTFLLFIGFSFTITAQNEVSVVCMGYGDQAEKAFWVRGEGAAIFVDHLFENYNHVNRRGYIHRFKNVAVPGVSGQFMLKIHEGVHGHSSDGSCSSSYFNTFNNEFIIYDIR